MCAFVRSIIAVLSLVGVFSGSAPARAESESASGISIDWSGLYAGLHGGYGWTRLDSGLGKDIDVDGWLAGGHVGLQRQFDRWVVGIEASYTGGDMDGSATIAGLADVKATVSDILMVTGRLGYAWRDRLFYVKGGYASADVDMKITTLGGTFSSDWRSNGWTAGIGFERHLTRNVSIGLEYNYIDLGAKTFTFSGGGGPVILSSVKDPYCPPDKPVSGRLDPDGIHAIMARVSFRLGDEPEHVPYK